MFFEDANMELLKSVAQEFVEYSPEMLYCKIYNDFLVDLVTKVLNSRNKVLAAKQKTRENQLQKICLSKIEKHLENSNIVGHVDGIGELDRAISEIIESSDVHDVKKVLSYPVVRDEINRAFKEGNRGDRYGAVLSAIVSMLLKVLCIYGYNHNIKDRNSVLHHIELFLNRHHLFLRVFKLLSNETQVNNQPIMHVRSSTMLYSLP